LGKALNKGNPLIVMVSLEGCPFCRVARDSYLEPLRRQEGMPVFQIDMRSPSTVRDFSGATVTHDQLVQAWRITIAPTVLFFGPRGKELVARMEGGYIPDFYGAYLDQRIEQARALIKAAKPG
jgi:thioredoxin-related protein